MKCEHTKYYKTRTRLRLLGLCRLRPATRERGHAGRLLGACAQKVLRGQGISSAHRRVDHAANPTPLPHRGPIAGKALFSQTTGSDPGAGKSRPLVERLGRACVRLKQGYSARRGRRAEQASRLCHPVRFAAAPSEFRFNGTSRCHQSPGAGHSSIFLLRMFSSGRSWVRLSLCPMAEIPACRRNI